MTYLNYVGDSQICNKTSMVFYITYSLNVTWSTGVQWSERQTQSRRSGVQILLNVTCGALECSGQNVRLPIKTIRGSNPLKCDMWSTGVQWSERQTQSRRSGVQILLNVTCGALECSGQNVRLNQDDQGFKSS